MHNFVYLAQRRSEEFSCERNFGGGASPPWLRQWGLRNGTVSVRLSVPFICCSSLRRVCCCGPDGYEISIDYCTAGAAAARHAAANAGSATFTVDVGS